MKQKSFAVVKFAVVRKLGFGKGKALRIADFVGRSRYGWNIDRFKVKAFAKE